MRIFLIGASGRTGREVVDQALARGHAVTAFVRSAAKVTRRDGALSIVQGDPVETAAIARAMAGHDAVVTTLGPTEPFKPSTLMRDSGRACVLAMATAGVKRLMVLSAAGHFPGLLGGIARTVLRDHMRDSLEMEGIVRASGLEWTLARPPALTEGRSVGFRSREDALPRFGFFLSRRALAAFMLTAIEQRAYVRKIVGIAR